MGLWKNLGSNVETDEFKARENYDYMVKMYPNDKFRFVRIICATDVLDE